MRIRFFEAIKDKYIPIAVENNIDYPSEDIFRFNFPKNPCFIFGAENAGLTDQILNKCNCCLFIPGMGSIRSLNVGTCSGIVMSLYKQFFYA